MSIRAQLEPTVPLYKRRVYVERYSFHRLNIFKKSYANGSTASDHYFIPQK